jgi:hypothetical protein
MQKIMLIMACWCIGAGLLAQPNITRVEYFFDTDPGFGAATAVTITPGPNLVDIGFTPSIASLSEGLHSLYIRSRDANGKWSVTNRFLFVKLSSSASAPNINKAEYFIDSDPGFGSGTNIPLSAAPDLADQAFSVNLTGLSEGLHSLFIRTRDVNGKWSVTNRFLFVRASPTLATPNITRVEYFWDLDPGFGNAINVPVTPGSDLIDIPLNASIASLPEGLHSLFIRSRDANGKWSVTNRFLFVRASPSLLPAPVKAAEYFIDTDPGFGNAVPIALNQSPNIPDFAFPVNITGLSVATHRLYIRSQDSIGKWSVTNIIEFPIASTASAPFINVNAITKKIMCGDNSFNVSFHATGTFNPGNTFTVQLSNAAGSFASPINIGSVISTTSSLVNCKIPLHIANGNAYRVRVVSSNPIVNGATSDTVFTLYDQPRYNDTTVNIICQGETVNLTTVYTTTGFTTSWNTGNPAVAPAGVYQLISSNTNLCKDTSIVTVKQDIAIWTGTASKNWHTASNWNTGKVPYEKTHVIINAGTPNTCELSASNVSVSSLQVRPGAVMNVINNRQVIITASCNPLPPGP